jgi:tetratricopeptide (TPR) repeat protein/Txe/YoeB family toxin of Txe-Axe toxin-antitoxin module
MQASFDNVYVSPRVRVALHSLLDTQTTAKLLTVVNKLKQGSFSLPGLRVERLRTRVGKVYSARLNIDIRVIFSMYSDRQGKRSLVIWDADHHDDAYSRIARTVVPAMFQPSANFLEADQIWQWAAEESNQPHAEAEVADSEEMLSGLLLFKVPDAALHQAEQLKAFEKNADRYLRLSEEQEELLGKHDKVHLIQGCAGTGKTSLALFYALDLHEQHRQDDVFFFTYHDELACVCRCYAHNLLKPGDDETASGSLRVFSFLEFCRHYLRSHKDVDRGDWTWIDRQRSIKHLKEVVSSRARWQRSFDPQTVYDYIYSIFKGRLVPGTDRLPAVADEFRRIFKDYGALPFNLDEVLEIFGHYEERLTRHKHKDEADLIRLCYETFKSRATLAAPEKNTWLVIDEIQDFTELEWKSLLLFWENQCLAQGATSFPFLCGDKHQNISQSGFRWQEVDAYVENILRSVHRQNALQQMQLHANVRNTLQIFQLGSFLHGLASQAKEDLGSPPRAQGCVPQLVVGKPEDFSQFLKFVADIKEESQAPLVVLFEDEAACRSETLQSAQCDNLFFMPLTTSKGLEYEDLIIYRPFSSLSKHAGEKFDDQAAQRLCDLWYMAVMRARQNLLLFMTQEDLDRFDRLLGKKYPDFLRLVEVQTGAPQSQLLNFFNAREKFLPNYAVIFLERTKANQIWQEYKGLSKEGPSQQAEKLKAQSFRLWQRCRDAESLGRACLELQEYERAIPYLEQASAYSDVAFCLEKLGRYEEAAQYFEREGRLIDAAQCFERSKRYKPAAELFERCGQWLQAATNFYLSGNNGKAAECFEHAKMWQSAADLYKIKSNWAKAAQLYQQCEQYELAADMYLKLQNKLDAARCCAKAQVFEKAAHLFESVSHFAEAAECHERSYNWDRAGESYSKAGRLKDAARCKEQAGDLASAIAAYERLKQWDKAARAYLQLQQPAKAAECFEKDKNYDEALTLWTKLERHEKIASALEHLGRYSEAAQDYVKASWHNDAGHAYEKAECFAEAADQYLKANNYSSAASMLARIGRRLDAARLFLLSGQAPVAVEVLHPSGVVAGRIRDDDRQLLGHLILWAEESAKPEVAAALHEALGDFDKAAIFYKRGMHLSKAANCAEKKGKFDIAGDLYLQDGKFEQAAQCFKSAKQMKRAALCYEMLKDWNQARRLYEELNDEEGVLRCQSAANWL